MNGQEKEELLELLRECQRALNQIPNVNIKKSCMFYENTYQLVKDISKQIRELEKL